MITKEVRQWLEKVNRNQYSYQDVMLEFADISRYLTADELNFIKKQLEKSYKT